MTRRPHGRGAGASTLGWILLVALALPACGGGSLERPAEAEAGRGSAASPGSRGYLRYRMPQDPPTLDPHDANDESSNLYIFNLFDGLVEFKPGTAEVAPALAASWEVSDDLRTYTFHLREGATFHNGREIGSGDVVYSLHRALEKGRPAAARPILMKLEGAREYAEGQAESVKGISAPDARTVVLTLEEPAFTFLPALATPGGSIVPREVYDTEETGYLRHPVGSGPFRFEEYRSGLHVKMGAFADHWKGAPGLPGITIRIIPDVNTALQEYRKGDLDFSNEVPAGKRDEVRSEFPGEYKVRERLCTAYLLMNQAIAPFKGNPALRRAVSHAVDRRRIASVFQEGKDTPSSWLLPPDMAGGRDSFGPVRHDPARVAELLEQAGHPGGEGLPVLRILVQDNESITRWVSAVRDDLQRAGFKAEMEILDFNAYVSRLFEGPTQELIVLIWYADYADPESTMGQVFHSASRSNFGNYSNPRVDRILERAREEMDPTRRLEAYLEAERMILEDGGAVTIYHQGDDLLVKGHVSGIRQSPLGDFAIPLELAGYRD